MGKNHKGWTKAKMDAYKAHCDNGYRDFDADEWVKMQCAHDDARPMTLWERIVG